MTGQLETERPDGWHEEVWTYREQVGEGDVPEHSLALMLPRLTFVQCCSNLWTG